METNFTYRAAAHRVGRSIRTIKRWRRSGMPMTFNHAGERIVTEAVLLAWWRDRLTNDPAHQYRLRAAQKAAQHADTPKQTGDV